MRREDLLIELGTEELPPKSLRALRDAFAAGVAQELTAARLDFGMVTAYATPRRLAVKITDVLAQQPDQVEEKLGPALVAAFTAEGAPTQAALGFARGLSLIHI